MYAYNKGTNGEQTSSEYHNVQPSVNGQISNPESIVQRNPNSPTTESTKEKDIDLVQIFNRQLPNPLISIQAGIRTKHRSRIELVNQTGIELINKNLVREIDNRHLPDILTAFYKNTERTTEHESN